MEMSDPRKDAIPLNSIADGVKSSSEGVAFSDSSCFNDDPSDDSDDCRSGGSSDMVYCIHCMYVYRIYMSSLS